MKYFSDMTQKLYDTEELLVAAEKEAAAELARKEEEARKAKEAEETKKNERKARADEIEAARKAMLEAQRKYQELVSAFVRDYKTYHYSTSSAEGLPTLFKDWLSLFDF